MMVMNEETIRFMVGLNPRAWEVHCVEGNFCWTQVYKNKSADVAAMVNDWEGYKITHLSMPETGTVAIWLDGEER